MMTYAIQQRHRVTINTDPQRRCYNGCHYSSKQVWTEWETLESGIQGNAIKQKLQFWRELNDYAISERGENARKEYRSTEED